MKFTIKKSDIPFKLPFDLLDGELAINLADKKLYFGYNNASYEFEPALCDTANKLRNQVRINGTIFDGSSDITTNTWGHPIQLTIGGSTKSVNGESDVSYTLNEILPTTQTGSVLQFTGVDWEAKPLLSSMTLAEAVAGISEEAESISPKVLKSATSQTVTELSSNSYEKQWVLEDGSASAYVQMLIDDDIAHLAIEPGTQEIEFQFHYTEEWKQWVGTGHLGVALRAIQNPHIGTSGAGIIIGPYDPFTNGNNIIPEFWGKDTTGTWRNWLSNVGISPRLVEGEKYKVVASYTIKDVRQRHGDAWIRYALYREIPGTLQRQAQWELVYDSGAIDNPNITNKDAVEGAHGITTFWISSNSDPKGPFFDNVRTYWRKLPDQKTTSILPITHFAANHYRTWRLIKNSDTSIRVMPYTSKVFAYPMNAGDNCLIGNNLTASTVGLQNDRIYYVVPDGKDVYGLLKIKISDTVIPRWTEQFGWIIGEIDGVNMYGKAIPILGAFILEGGVIHDTFTKRHIVSFANQEPRELYVTNSGSISVGTNTELVSVSFISMGNVNSLQMGKYQPIDYAYNVHVKSGAGQEYTTSVRVFDGVDVIPPTSVRRVYTNNSGTDIDSYSTVSDKLITSPVTHPHRTTMVLQATKHSSGAVTAQAGACVLQCKINDR